MADPLPDARDVKYLQIAYQIMKAIKSGESSITVDGHLADDIITKLRAKNYRVYPSECPCDPFNGRCCCPEQR